MLSSAMGTKRVRGVVVNHGQVVRSVLYFASSGLSVEPWSRITRKSHIPPAWRFYQLHTPSPPACRHKPGARGAGCTSALPPSQSKAKARLIHLKIGLREAHPQCGSLTMWFS